MDEQRYQTLSEAAKVAVTRCSRWHFATAKDDLYDPDSLVGIAGVHDDEVGVDEDSYYIVSPQGAIGFCQDGDSIEWLFLPIDDTMPPSP